MRVSPAAALVTILVGTAVLPRTGAAQQLPLLPPPPAFAPAPPPQPFGNLFGPVRPVKPKAVPLFAPLVRDAAKNELGARPSRTIVCGMKLVPADPAFEASMRRTKPDNSPAFTMRTAPPPVCRQ